MHPAGKIIIGLVLIIIGLGLFVDSVVPLSGGLGTFGIDWLTNFFVVLTGIIPIFLILIGLFVVWLESDELKSRKEISQEMKKEEKPAEKKKGQK
jgi:cadmium resistance protein CadD (predicted permease)